MEIRNGLLFEPVDIARQNMLKLFCKNSLASAVATQEATDEDSNWLLCKPVNAATVAIRKARRLANGWRFNAGCVRYKFSWSSTLVHSLQKFASSLPALKNLIFTKFSASAVATQEATDEDSDWLRKMQFKETTVSIRKPRGLGNGLSQRQPSPFASLQANSGKKTIKLQNFK